MLASLCPQLTPTYTSVTKEAQQVGQIVGEDTPATRVKGNGTDKVTLTDLFSATNYDSPAVIISDEPQQTFSNANLNRPVVNIQEELAGEFLRTFKCLSRVTYS